LLIFGLLHVCISVDSAKIDLDTGVVRNTVMRHTGIYMLLAFFITLGTLSTPLLIDGEF
jgi:cytochrome c553